MTPEEKAVRYLALAGGKENIRAVTNCMTRVRLSLYHGGSADPAALKNEEDVMGVIAEGNDLQIVVGPGRSAKIAAEIARLSESADPAAALKKEAESRGPVSYKLFMKRIAGIFVPLIPAFMGCGLLLALYQFCGIYAPQFEASPAGILLGIVSSSVFSIMSIIVGYNAAKEFGGSPVIGSVLAYVLTSPAIDGIQMMGITFAAGRGGVISVLAAAGIGAQLEKKVRSVMPDALDTFVSPLIVIFVMTFAGLIVLQPVCGIISEAVGSFVSWVISDVPVLAGIASLVFLPLVATGMHHGLVAVNTQLIADFGMTYLLPVTCMAGAGQVGAVLYILLKTRNKKLKRICASALPAGILGIGEPLMWGVTIPLGRPFIASCIGGGIGGSAIALMKVAAKIPTLSGIQLSLVTNSPLRYLLGIVISYAAGFAACMLLGFDDSSFQ